MINFENLTVSPPQLIFEGGQQDQKSSHGVFSYRIPALLLTHSGNLLAAADQRMEHHFDWGDIRTVIRRSQDKGITWNPITTVVDLADNPNPATDEEKAAFTIDTALIQEPSSQRIFALYDMYPEGRGIFGMAEQFEAAHTRIGEKYYLNLYCNKKNQAYTIRENGQIFSPENEPTDFFVTIESTQAPYSDLGNLYQEGKYLGNVFHTSNQTAPFRVAKTSYIWLSHSDDDGQTWSCPRDITAQLRTPQMKFLGVSPGAGIVLKYGSYAGRLIIPAYTTNFVSHLTGSQSSRVIYSDDAGQTWQIGQAINDHRRLSTEEIIHSETMDNELAQNTESVAVQLKNGNLKLFMRNLNGHLQVATSKDGGLSWETTIQEYPNITDAYVQLSAIQLEENNEEYILLANAEGPGRTNGHLRIAKVEENGDFTWLYSHLIQEGEFAYNSLQQLSANEFILLYEHRSEEQNPFSIYARKLTFSS